MKTYLRFFILVLGLSPLFVSAQSDMEDVIYLKNGTIYKGTMLDQQFGVSYKIQIQGGSVIVVAASDIEKVTKEKRAWSHADSLNKQSAYPNGVPMDDYQTADHHPRHNEKEGTGGFFEAQFSPQYAGFGVKIVSGYKFNQFAILGAGIGIGSDYSGVKQHNIEGDQSPYGAQYYPIFIYFGGDILKKEVTPFYFLEAGYAMASNIAGTYDKGDNPNNYLTNTTTGGPMEDVGIGLRVYGPPTRKNREAFVFTLAADLNIQYARTDVYWVAGEESYGPLPPAVRAHTTMLIPGLKIGVGFIK